MAAEVLREELDGEHRYRITRIDSGHLVTMRSRKGTALWMPTEWLHRTPEAANACLDAVIAYNAVWLAMQAGHASATLMHAAELRTAAHNVVCSRLDDHPVIGQDIEVLRGRDDLAV